MSKIVVAIGHTRRGDSGAVSVGGVSEWEYNSALANEQIAPDLRAMGHEVLVLDELDSGSYSAWVRHVASECERFKSDYGCEMHFNSSSSSQSHGHEYLFYHRSSRSRRLARAFADAQQAADPESKGRDSRPRENGIYPKTGGNGYQMLYNTPCPFVITEPFFGSNPEEWVRYRIGDLVTKITVGALHQYGGGVATPQPPPTTPVRTIEERLARIEQHLNIA